MLSKRYDPQIKGHLDIFVAHNEDEHNGRKECWDEVLIHGDPEGLKSLASLLLKLADLDQEQDESLPVDAREHEHLNPRLELSESSVPVIVGRLDAKGTGAFYDRYVARKS